MYYISWGNTEGFVVCHLSPKWRSSQILESAYTAGISETLQLYSIWGYSGILSELLLILKKERRREN